MRTKLDDLPGPIQGLVVAGGIITAAVLFMAIVGVVVWTMLLFRIPPIMALIMFVAVAGPSCLLAGVLLWARHDRLIREDLIRVELGCMPGYHKDLIRSYQYFGAESAKDKAAEMRKEFEKEEALRAARKRKVA